MLVDKSAQSPPIEPGHPQMWSLGTDVFSCALKTRFYLNKIDAFMHEGL